MFSILFLKIISSNFFIIGMYVSFPFLTVVTFFLFLLIDNSRPDDTYLFYCYFDMISHVDTNTKDEFYYDSFNSNVNRYLISN